MTDTTDDIAEEISFQSFDDDCKLLGSLLNDVLQREVGSEFMEKVERTRILAQVLLKFLLFFLLHACLSLIEFVFPLTISEWNLCVTRVLVT